MDPILNSKNNTQSIYEIYRACRLCGGGAGYKMPIIQNIVDLDESDVELQQKIRECVQIEVHPEDKMPPLICELCVDKLNDFYEFLDMCRQTNKRTRLRLGLPPQSLPKGAPDAGDCILGVTEPLFVNEDSDAEPLSKSKKSVKIKKEPVVRIKIENLEDEVIIRNKNSEHQRTSRRRTSEEHERSTRHGNSKERERLTRNSNSKEHERSTRHSNSKERERSTRNSNSKEHERSTRHSNSKEHERSTRHSNSKEHERSTRHNNSKERERSTRNSNSKECERSTRHRNSEEIERSSRNRTRDSTPPRVTRMSRSREDDVALSTIKTEQSTLQKSCLKRSRDKDPVKLETPAKKLKVSIKPLTPPPSHSKSSPKSTPKSSPKSSPRVLPKPKQLKSQVSPLAKLKGPTSPIEKTFYCGICGLKLKTIQARISHLRTHNVGSKHIEDRQSVPFSRVPEVKCDSCWKSFPTQTLLDEHKCLGENYMGGGKCNICKRSYATLKSLKKHVCTKKKGVFISNKKILDKIKPIQVRIARCDPLLTNVKDKYYDVSTVPNEYGLDKNCYYPYISGLRIKSEFDGMVDIHDEIRKEFCSEDYVHWDSDDESSDEEITCDMALNPSAKKKKVPSLSAIALKTIFSYRLLGKVPKKKRKLKHDKVFDSMLADHDEVRMGINSLIDNLGDDNIDDSDKKVDKININNVQKDVINDTVSKNCVNDNDSQSYTDSVNDSTIVSSFIEDSNKNTDKDNSSIDSIDILENLKSNLNENNSTENKIINDNYDNDLTKVTEPESLQSDSKDLNVKLNNDKYSVESILSNSVQNKSSEHVKNNDSEPNNDFIDQSNDKKMDESNIINKVKDNNSSNDKVIDSIDDILKNSTENKVGLGINDFSFDY